MKRTGMIRKPLIILFWVGIWVIAAKVVNQPLLLPSPGSVAMRIIALIALPNFWKITALSLLRITVGILSAVVLGVVFAVITGRSELLQDLFSPILTIIKVTPVASFIILVLVWIGRDYVPSVIAALMVLPVVWHNVRAGLKNVNPELIEMVEIYHVPRHTRFLRLTLPSVMPYFLSAIQTSIGIGWKAGIAAEVLTVPARSIGKMIYESKLYLETTDLFAWTVVVVLISLFIETLIVSSIKKFGQKFNGEVSVNG